MKRKQFQTLWSHSPSQGYHSGSLHELLWWKKEDDDLKFSFLWDNKPDKIKRVTICQDYDNGGLKMLDIDSFEKALKVIWVKKLLLQPESQ